MRPGHHLVLRAFLVVAGALTSTGAPLDAGTLHVPGDAPTIQEAIALANYGDKILVAPGTYVEQLDFLGKRLALQGVGGASVTTIDAQGAGTVVRLDTAEPAGTLIRGFTITGGTTGQDVEITTMFGTNTFTGGAGVFVGESAHLEMHDCVVTGNALDGASATLGGGVGTYLATVTLVGCTLSNNFADKGGALGTIMAGSIINLYDCTITANSVSGSASGAAVFVVGPPNFTARNCRVTDNLCTGLGAFDGIPHVSGCTFSGNDGWGCIAYGFVGVVMSDCSFLGNTLGGASLTSSDAIAEHSIERCVFASGDNLKAHTSILLSHCTFDGAHVQVGGSDHVQALNCIARNTGGFVQGTLAPPNVSYSNVEGGAPGSGNIDVDPQWVNATAHDYHLVSGSPCVDAGHPAMPPDADFTTADMGAFPLAGWNDLGGGITDARLLGQGFLTGGQPVALALHSMPEQAPTVLILGLTQLGIGFKGGLLWPALDIVLSGFVTDFSGELSIQTTWPAGVPSGTTVTVQIWAASPAAPQGFAASNGVQATAP